VLLRGTAIVSILTLLSRILGFGRDLLVARLLGASIFADAFFVAFRIPNLLRSFVAEGALTSAFTPVFSESLAQGKEHARSVLRRVSSFLILVTLALTLLLITLAPDIVALLAPGFLADSTQFSLCVQLTRIMAPYILCVSLIAMLNAALNTLHVFGTSAWAQVVMNLVLIVAALLAIPFDPTTATLILSGSVLIGGIAQILAQLPACARAGLSIRPSLQFLCGEVGSIVRLMIPAIVGASVYQLTIFIATVLASLVSAGSVSWLFYADRVAQFPVGIFSIALASVLLPALSNASANADPDGFNRNLANSLRYTSFFMIPMSAGLWALALPITQMLFERGAFTHESSVKTADALQALSLGLWAMSCHSMLVRAFIARKDTITPTLSGLATLITSVIVSLLVMGQFQVSEPSTGVVRFLRSTQNVLVSSTGISLSLGHVGLALASSVAAFVSLVLVIIFFSFKMRSFPWIPFIGSTLRSLLASFVMVAVISFTLPLSSSPEIASLIGMSCGGLSLLGTLWLLRSRELRETLAVLASKMRRRAR
jgi:putative peptidoglycan lipid II flippase